MPLLFINSLIDQLANWLILFCADDNIRFDKSTADSFFVPLRNKIATNSVSVRAWLPCAIYFSLGRSAMDHSVIGNLFLYSEYIQCYIVFCRLSTYGSKI